MTRFTVAFETRNKLAMVAVDPVPASISAMILARWEGERLGLRPRCRPARLACSKPWSVRSRIISRSNSATAPSIWVINRPGAVVVSIASVREQKPAPAAVIFSRVNNRSRSERLSRSSFQTTRTSPELSAAIALASCRRSASPPEASSLNTVSQPAAVNVVSWFSRSWWSPRETRA